MQNLIPGSVVIAGGIIPLFAVDIVCPLFNYSLRRSAATVVPLPGGGTIILGLLLFIRSLHFLRCICRFSALLGWPLGVIPPDMVPLPTLVVPAAPVILLPGALPGCLRSLTG